MVEGDNMNECPYLDKKSIFPMCSWKIAGRQPSLRIIKQIPHKCNRVRIVIQGKKRKIVINNFITG